MLVFAAVVFQVRSPDDRPIIVNPSISDSAENPPTKCDSLTGFLPENFHSRLHSQLKIDGDDRGEAPA